MLLRAACVQLNAGPAIQDNLNDAETYIREAVDAGARLVVTPENSCHIRVPAKEKLKSAQREQESDAIKRYSALAKELGIILVAGSFSILLENDKIANRCYVFGQDGGVIATYDKAHMFDVDLPTGESHRESEIFAPGNKLAIAETDEAKLGLSICYDMRFPEMYRDMAKAGAQIMLAPSAFTVPTGQAHWHVLLRARAIETGCFVMAPAQCGEHEGRRQTYGHSLIVSPWGQVVAEAGDEPGIIYADLDLDEVDKARQAIPALAHDRDISC